MSVSEIFRAENGKSYFVTFGLVSTLFLLWGTCNGMIDVMDKHFQDLLHLSKAQSAWVQFAHYVGYLVMALPASWLARKLGYKGGIIAGLLLVSVGGFWFIPATHIAAFWVFLLGVCVIAMGLTILETAALPLSYFSTSNSVYFRQVPALSSFRISSQGNHLSNHLPQIKSAQARGFRPLNTCALHSCE